MPNFDRTRTAFIEQKIDEKMQSEKIGKVIRVYERAEVDSNSNFEADVVMDGGTREERVAPISMPNDDSISIPKVGDAVGVTYMAGESRPPLITGFVSTSTDRPPLGKAGMRREEYESDTSPAGDGNLYVTGYTSYDQDVARVDKRDATPEESFVQIAKRAGDVADPTEESALPAKIEFYDAPASDESHITVELNKRDGSDSDATWGLKFDMKTGEVKLVDPSGYGFVSDGDGNWTWEYESKTENQVSNGGSLSL